MKKSNEFKIKRDIRVAGIKSNLKDVYRQYLDKKSLSGYELDWHIFETYCINNKLTPLPATETTVCDFLINIRTLKGRQYKTSSLRRFLVTINKKHIEEMYKSPTVTRMVNMVLTSVRKEDPRSIRSARALNYQELKRVIYSLSRDKTNINTRDKALLLIGFGGAVRRSELGQIKKKDIIFTEYGFDLIIRNNIPEKMQKKVFVYAKDKKMCPVEAVRSLLEVFKVSENDNIFKQVRKGGVIQKDDLGLFGIDGIIKKHFYFCSAQSLRAGFINETSNRGKTIPEIMNQTGIKTYKHVESRIKVRQGVVNNAVIGLF